MGKLHCALVFGQASPHVPKGKACTALMLRAASLCCTTGVHPSPDGADVATPVSLVEWFWGFYEEARESKTPPLECTLRAGEVRGRLVRMCSCLVQAGM